MPEKRANRMWEIGRKGRAWRSGEGLERFYLALEKIEMVGGKLFNNDRERLVVLGLLLENMGTEAAVRLGAPDAWREAVARLR